MTDKRVKFTAVKELTDLLANISEGLKEKKITEQEYVELMADVERLRQVIALAEDLALNIRINETIKGIIELAKMIR